MPLLECLFITSLLFCSTVFKAEMQKQRFALVFALKNILDLRTTTIPVSSYYYD